ECVAQMRAEFAMRREFVCRRLAEIPGIKLPRPDGAFYAFFDVSAHFGKPLTGGPLAHSTEFCRAALAGAHLCLVQGSAFGCEGFVRMSFATSMEVLEAGLGRLEQWLRGK